MPPEYCSYANIPGVAGEDDLKRLRFDLAHANLLSISSAQRFYLSTLLVFLSLVWGWVFVGEGEAVTIQLLGVGLKTGGVWKITPLVSTLLSLALIGSINAAGPAWIELKAAFDECGLTAPRSNPIFYDLDTHKNIFDYFAFLRVRPEGGLRDIEDLDRRRSFGFRHFLYPTLFLASIYTTFRAVHEPFAAGDRSSHTPFLIYGWICIGLQCLYAFRPVYRAVCRFFGIRTSFVYD
jgi:hypothetical protein